MNKANGGGRMQRRTESQSVGRETKTMKETKGGGKGRDALQ